MMQFSVYCKIFPNREAAVKHVNILKKNIPKEGQIRLLLVTEKQYSKIEIIVGGVSNQEKTVNGRFFYKIMNLLTVKKGNKRYDFADR